VEGPTNSEPKEDPPSKRSWEAMTLVCVGDVTDFVRGGGKSGQNSDMDPQGTQKRGNG
jgi:hypothetical protein